MAVTVSATAKNYLYIHMGTCHMCIGERACTERERERETERHRHKRKIPSVDAASAAV